MRTGVILPTFRDTPTDAFETAKRAFDAGVDGVFCYDHIWPIGQPERPALAPFPILASLISSLDPPVSTDGSGPFFGTLVARIGLVPNEVLFNEFMALKHLAPGRVIAGLGTGDRLSEHENEAYGIPFAPAAERRSELVELARSLRGEDLAVWVAGGIAARTQEAKAADSALNVWDASPTVVTERCDGDSIEVTWAGPAPTSDDALIDQVVALRRAGATWTVFGWPVNMEVLVAAAATTTKG